MTSPVTVSPALNFSSTEILLENEGLDLVAQVHDVRRVGVLADGELAGRDNALALEPNVNEHLVVLDLHDGAVDQVALVELG